MTKGVTGILSALTLISMFGSMVWSTSSVVHSIDKNTVSIGKLESAMTLSFENKAELDKRSIRAEIWIKTIRENKEKIRYLSDRAILYESKI